MKNLKKFAVVFGIALVLTGCSLGPSKPVTLNPTQEQIKSKKDADKLKRDLQVTMDIIDGVTDWPTEMKIRSNGKIVTCYEFAGRFDGAGSGVACDFANGQEKDPKVSKKMAEDYLKRNP